MRSTSSVYVFRLKPHDDLKKSILQFARTHSVKAGILLTCVGSLEQCNFRYANQKSGTMQKGYFEIVSAEGTFSDTAAHIHLAVADHNGKTTGGHLLEENLIYTTAEIAIAVLEDIAFERVTDPAYGYQELLVKKRQDRS